MPNKTSRISIRFALTLIISIAVSVGILWGTFRSSAFQNAAHSPAIVPVISATKADAVFTDVDGDGRADPGDTLNYTVVINNTGPDPATGTIFTDTLPNTLTLVPGSVNASPIGFDDSYAATGNIRITVATASGVLANDIDPNTGNNTGLTATAGATSTNGGNVTMNADGSFVYNPPAGFEGADTFNYTVTDTGGATGTGTVTFTVSGMIWFVNASAPGGGDGRLTSPFNCLVGAGCFDPVAADGAGDNIFLFSGNYTGGLTLLANQRLIGQGASASISAITGITPPAGSDALPSTGGAQPAITTAAASTNGVNVGSGNTLRGFNIGNTTAVDIAGTGFGTLTIADMDLSGTGRLLNLTTGTLAATFGSLATTSASGGPGVSLTTIGGTLTVTGTTSIIGASTQGISISGSSVAANFGTSTTIGSITQGILVGTSTGNISFGNTTINAGTDGISLQNNSAGTRSFGTLSTTNGTGVGFLHGVGGGAATISGTATFTNPGGRCIDIQSNTTAVTFANVNATQCGGTGVFLNANSGAVAFADLDISPDAGQRPLHATNNTGAITTTSGTIPTSGTAVAVEITNASGTVPLNMQLTSVSANGGSSGIILTNTSSSGAPGGFRVLGTGGSCTVATPTCTGGTIQNTTSHGINMNNVANAVFNSIRVTGSDDSGINGATVNGFVLNNSLIDANGDNAATDDVGVEFTNLTGTASAGANPTSITNNVIRNNFEFEIQITNSTGTLTNLEMSGNAISSDGFQPNHGNLINFLVPGAATGTMTLNVTSGTFTGNTDTSGGRIITATGVQCDHSGSGGTLTCNISGATFTNNNVGPQASVAGNGQVVFNFSNNNIQGTRSSAINFFADANPPFTKTLTGRVQNNTVGTLGVANSGANLGNGIRIQNEGAVPVTMLISGNTIQEVTSFPGINVNMGLGGIATGGQQNNYTVLNNTVRNIGSRAIVIQDNQTSPNTPAPTVCVDMSGNAFSGIAGQAGDGSFVRLRELNGIMNVRQAAPTAAVNAAELDDANSGNDPTLTKYPIGGTPQFGQPSCAQPPIAPPDEEKNLAFAGFDNNLSFVKASYDEPLAFLTDIDALERQVARAKANETPEMVGTNGTLLGQFGTDGTRGTAGQRDNGTWDTVAGLLTRIGEMISPTAYSQEVKKDENVKQSDDSKKDSDAKEPESGETITVNGGGAGFTLPSNKSTTITFRAVIGNPQPALTQVSNQGSVAGNFTTVLTDDPDVAGSANPTVTNIDHTTVAVASNANPSVFGQNVTFTATMTGVPSRASDPPGTVQFKADGNNIGAPVAVVVGTVNDNVSSAQASISTLSVGNHVIAAEYSGGGSGATGYNANTGTLAGGQVVGKANTTTGLTSSQNPSVFGQPVTFTATVAPVAPGTGSPTGTVNFLDGGNPITGCQNVTLQTSQAQCQPGSISVGNHTITAQYSGDTNFNTSTGNMTGNPQVVNKANTTVGLTSSQNPAPQGTTLTFVAIINVVAPGAGVPSGTVQFLDGGNPVAGCTSVPVAGAMASCQTNALTVGNHTITAQYSGDASFNTSTGSLTGNPQVITGPPVLVPTVGLTRIASDPAVNSQIATVSDDVSNPGGITVTLFSAPTGMTVTNIVNTNGNITANLAAGCAAATGNNTIVLRATDGKNLSQNANLVVNVQANPAPTLGNYGNQTIVTSCKLLVEPDAIPADNQPLVSVTATSPTFGGTLTVDPVSGIVTASNSGPVPGPHTITVTATDSCGTQTTKNFTITVVNPPTAPVKFDFDGDRKADISVYRAGLTANDVSTWFILRSSDNTVRINQFGNGEDRIVPADYTGDGVTDLAVVRPSTNTWYYSGDTVNPGQNFTSIPWGQAGDVPVPGRFDADNKTDIAVFRPSDGSWWIAKSTGGTDVRFWGTMGDKPIPIDYDADGMTDLVQYRDSNLSFYILKSTGGSAVQPWGISGDKLVPADYDGDGEDDIAVWRPSTGDWWILQSTGGVRTEHWGLVGDKPAPADFDHDGKADLSVYRPIEGVWYIFNSCPCVGTGSLWGIATDTPVPSAFTP